MSRGPEPARGGALVVVYATVFLDLLGFGLILPFLPYYAEELGASGFGLGLLFASYSLAQLVGSPLLGRLSDRWGRRPVLLASLAGGAAAMVASALAGSLATLCLARALAGLAGGSIGTAQAYVADVTSRRERARYMGFVGASIGLGFVFGPALGVFLEWALGVGFAGAALVAATLAAANLAAAFWLLPEPERRRPHGRTSLAELAAAFGRPVLRPVLAATFLLTFAFVGMETTFAYYGKAAFGLDERGFGLVLVYVGMVAILVQGGLIGVLTRRFGVGSVAAAGGLLMGLSLLLLPLGPRLWAVLAALGVLAFGHGLAAPTLPTLASLASGESEQGAILGLRQSLGSAARAVGPLAAGALYDFSPAAPYLFGGALALLAGFLIMGARTAVPLAQGDGE